MPAEMTPEQEDAATEAWTEISRVITPPHAARDWRLASWLYRNDHEELLLPDDLADMRAAYPEIAAERAAGGSANG